MTLDTALAKLDAGETLNVTLPNGETGAIWYINCSTGDVCIVGHKGEAWMDCSDGSFRVDFN